MVSLQMLLTRLTSFPAGASELHTAVGGGTVLEFRSRWTDLQRKIDNTRSRERVVIGGERVLPEFGLFATDVHHNCLSSYTPCQSVLMVLL